MNSPSTYELAIHARCAANQLAASRPGTAARWGYFSVLIRSVHIIWHDLYDLLYSAERGCVLGQISASLAAMHRTVDDYDSMAKRELIKVKQEKAQMCAHHLSFIVGYIDGFELCRRVQKFRSDYTELRNEFERLKTEAEREVRITLSRPYFASLTAALHRHQKAATSRSELLSPGFPGSDARRRYGLSSNSSSTPEHETSASPFRTPSPMVNGATREQHLLREHTFTQQTSAQLDDFIAQGREVLDNLVDQRNMLKGTQRRLLDAANTLGLSRDVIGWIERRRCVPFAPSWRARPCIGLLS